MKMELKLTLKLDTGKQVTLNIDEAKELHAQLAEVFAPKVEKEYVPYPTYPTFPTYPTWKIYTTSADDYVNATITTT